MHWSRERTSVFIAVFPFGKWFMNLVENDSESAIPTPNLEPPETTRNSGFRKRRLCVNSLEGFGWSWWSILATMHKNSSKFTFQGSWHISFKGSWENDSFLFRCGGNVLVRRRVFRVPIEPCLTLRNDEAWISQVNFFRDFFWGNRSLLRIKVRIPLIKGISYGGFTVRNVHSLCQWNLKGCISLGTNPAGPWFNLLKDLGPSWHHLIPGTPLNVGYGLMKTPVW